jgi:2-methylcitrate dehydratase
MSVVDAAHGAQDEIASRLSDFAAQSDERLSVEAVHAAKRALFDAIAVGVGAFRHPAAQAARRYARRFRPGHERCTIWGTAESTTAEAATLANGVLLRCYDYNDLYVGKRSAAHPSDLIPGLVAVAESADLSGRKLLFAVALGYEITLDLLDTLPIAHGGWDYANLTAIAASCSVGRLMGLDRDQIREALAISVIPHFASDEIESGDLNSRGDLTMWKRFNGADAMRQAVYACTLAACGTEGAVRPFTGRLGLLAKLGAGEDALVSLRERLVPERPLGRIAEVTMKRWPVGSRAQSAIQAALAARAGVADISGIRRVRVTADPSAYEHLVRSRKDAWRPISRETADHSLPYIVAAAILDGHVGVDSFATPRVMQIERQRFLQRVEVVADARAERSRVAAGYASAYRTEVRIEMLDGATVTGEAEIAPGHPGNPLTETDLGQKLRESARADIDAVRLEQVLWDMENVASVRQLTRALGVAAGREIDSETAV